MNVRCCLKSKTACVSMVALAVLMGWALSWTAAPAMARSPEERYSPMLRGTFYVDRFLFHRIGWQPAACVVHLDHDSPLHAAGVRPGDLITRLDNVFVTNLGRLERHYCWTSVRYWRSPDGDPDSRRKTVHTSRMHIPNSRCRCR